MGKTFGPRAKKKTRKVQYFDPDVYSKLFQNTDEKLLAGAKLSDIPLHKIVIKKQVRTRFDEKSIADLAQNIKINGLIQPLVVHRENDKFVLLCGERRFRAMTSIEMDKAACFILEGKTHQEQMAIQFSENSSREELHYMDKALGIYNYQQATKASQRQIQKALAISKSEVHRALQLAILDQELQQAAKTFNIEKYVMLEYLELPSHDKTEVKDQLISGEITKRTQLRKWIKAKREGPATEASRPPAKKIRATKKVSRSSGKTTATKKITSQKDLLKKAQQILQ